MTTVPAAPASLPPRLPSLTGVRVILFLLVFFTHAVGASQFFSNPDVAGLATLFPDAIAALSMFFVISGFVLTWQRPWESTFGQFARRRVAKIFPSHLVTWTATVLILATLGPFALVGPTDIGPAIANLFLLQSWIPDPSYVFSVYGINWSVSCDIMCYIALPLLIKPIMRIPANRLFLWLIGTLVVIAAIPAVVNATVGGEVWPMWAPLSFGQVYAVYFSPLTKVPEFLLGVFLARMVQTGTWPNIKLRWAWAAMVALWLTMLVLPPIYRSSSIMALGVCLFVPALALRDIEGRSKWLSKRWMVVLGDASYAAYLVQFPVLGLVKTAIGPTRTFPVWSGTLLVLGLLVLNAGIGLLLYRFVERPVLRRFARRRTEQTPSPVVATA